MDKIVKDQVNHSVKTNNHVFDFAFVSLICVFEFVSLIFVSYFCSQRDGRDEGGVSFCLRRDEGDVAL